MTGSPSTMRRGGICERVVPDALLLRQQRDEGLLDEARAGRLLEFGRRAGGQHPAGIHRDQPVETLGLLHIGGRDDDAHAGAARAHAIDQFPELAARQRVDAGRRLVEDQQIGIVDQRAAQPELLPHAARQFLCRPVGERREPGAVEQLGDAPFPFGAGLSEQAAEELDVLADAEVGIEVLAEALRHIGDARADRGAMRGIGHIAAEDADLSRLDLPRAGDEREQRSTCRRRRGRSARPCSRPAASSVTSSSAATCRNDA